MKFRLSKIAGWLSAEISSKDREVTGYSIDTRTIAAGDLFFAIRGSARDGHEYVAAAFESGAAAAVVRSTWATKNETSGPVLAVTDPSQALGELAGYARRDWGNPLIAVTGSNGKTTTKELTAAVLGISFSVAKSEGNLNNQLGLPLSLLRFDEKSEVGVIEMGMNHIGEIRRLTDIAAPSVGIVTNVSAAHLKHFSSLDEIALAKRELIEQLPRGGTAILNNDDPRVTDFRKIFPGKTITFGIDTPADFQALDVETFGAQGVRFLLSSREQRKGIKLRFESPLLGRHNVANILAALATASTFGVETKKARDLIANFQAQGMRGETLQIGGVTILNDCYNSNPQALFEMLTVLQQTPAVRRVAVLGEMLELGAKTAALHHEMGREVVKTNVDLLVAIGRSAREIVSGAVDEQFPPDSAVYFKDVAEASLFLAKTVRSGDAVLLKASRQVRLEQTLDVIRQSLEKT